MAEYSTLKVAELKKLLTERKLSIAGNKPDLIARLEENDQETTKPADGAAAPAPKPVAEDEIDYDDDDIVPAAPASKPSEPKADTAGAAANASSTDAPAPTSTDKPSTAAEDASKPEAAAAAAETAPAEPLFSQHLASTNADDEAAKRAARAKRFGTTTAEDSEEARLAKRAERFGLDKAAIAKGLDSALPDRPRKRGRGGDLAEGEGAEDRAGKRRSDVGSGDDQQGRNRRRGGGRDQRSGGRGGGGRGGGGGGARDQPRQGQPQKQRGIFDDPVEKAKAEARAKRFASAAYCG